ncbi:hypothetical protein BDY24DRAFT_390719 [Mrakia frigida]|uniref:uncharacterized protein n=1 Tax=Mrakia frigida TaxID=29902 RepID=UPI003FCBEF23
MSAFSPLLDLLHQPFLAPLVLSSLLLLPLAIYRVLHRPPSPTRKARTRKFWFTMAVLVGPVWLLTPISYLAFGWGCLASLGWGGFSWPRGKGARIASGFGVGWASLEVLFSLIHLYLAYRIQPVTPPLTADPAQLRQIFLRVLQANLQRANHELVSEDDELSSLPEENLEEVLEEVEGALDIKHGGKGIERLEEDDERAVAFRERLRTWFYHADWDSLQRDNILDWISWSTFNSSLEHTLSIPAYKTVLLDALELIERRTGKILPPGRNESIRVIRLTLDKVNVRHRPLILYTLTWLLNQLCSVTYWSKGVKRVKFGEIEYLVHFPDDWTPEKGRKKAASSPILYIHGLGFGFLQNHFVISTLLRDYSSHPILVPIQPAISMTLPSRRHLVPFSRPETIRSLSLALDHYKFYSPDSDDHSGGVTIFSHSNGSTSHAWVLKDIPAAIRRSCFVDPVVFCLWEGDVCYNFVYRDPSTAIELLMSFFIGSELGIANTISRNFDWSSNTLFFEDIVNGTDASRTAFFLGGRDAIVHAERVKHYLEHHGVSKGLHYDPRGSHGEALLGKTLDKVLRWVGGEDHQDDGTTSTST